MSIFVPFVHSIFFMLMMSIGWLLLSISIFIHSERSLRVRMVDLFLFITVAFFLTNTFFFQVESTVSSRFFDIVGLVFLYLFIRVMSTYEGRKCSWLFLIILLLGGLVQASYGELQLYDIFPSLNSRFSVTGSFVNPGPYAGYLAVVFPLALGVYVSIEHVPGRPKFWDPIVKYVSLITLLLIVLVLSVAASRAAWLALIVSASFLCYWRYRWREKINEFLNSYFKRATGLFLGLLSIGTALFGIYLLKKSSADGRLLIWKISYEMAKDNLWTGRGLDQFKQGFMVAQAEWFRENPLHPTAPLADDVIYAFNEGLQLVVEQGLIGVVLVLSLLLVIFKLQGSIENPDIWIFKAGLISVLVFGMFSYPSHVLAIKICWVLFIALLAGHTKRIGELYPDRSGRLFRWATSVFVFSMGAGLLWQTHRLYQSASDWKSALVYYKNGASHASLPVYKKVYSVFSQDGEFLISYGKALSVAGDHQKAITILEEAKNYLNNSILQTALGDSYRSLGRYQEAEEAYCLAVHMLPDRFYPRYLLAKLYQEMGEEKKMKAIATYLVEKEPKVSSQAVKEIKKEMRILLDEKSKVFIPHYNN